MKKVLTLLLVLSLSLLAVSCNSEDENAGNNSGGYNGSPEQSVAESIETDETFSEAEQLFSSGSYLEAADTYKKVQQDSPNYQTAQERINEANTKYIEKVLTDADRYISETYYYDAEKSLEEAMKIFPENNDLQLKYDEAITAHFDDLSETVNNYILRQDYEGAISFIYSNDDIPAIAEKLQDTLKETEQLYISSVIKEAEDMAANGLSEMAIEKLQSAENIVSDTEELQNKITEIEDSIPVPLSDMKLTEVQTFEQITVEQGSVDDTLGNVYAPGNLFKMYTRSTLGGGSNDTGFTEIFLNKKYSTFTGTVAVSDSTERDATVRFEIYSDDKLIYHQDLTRKSVPVEFNVSVENTDWIKIQLVKPEDGGNGEVYLSEPTFSK